MSEFDGSDISIALAIYKAGKHLKGMIGRSAEESMCAPLAPIKLTQANIEQVMIDYHNHVAEWPVPRCILTKKDE
jgi:hypothetical protein